MQTDILVSSTNLSSALSACLNKPKPCFDKHYYIFINVSNLIMLTSGNHVTIETESVWKSAVTVLGLTAEETQKSKLGT